LNPSFDKSSFKIIQLHHGICDTSNLPVLCANAGEFLKRDYDFAVAGGGTAGLVVAARLTEYPSIHVGVFEVGAANIGDPMIMIPAMTIRQIGIPNMTGITRQFLRYARGGDLPNSHKLRIDKSTDNKIAICAQFRCSLASRSWPWWF